jgi:hypothetical protein
MGDWKELLFGIGVSATLCVFVLIVGLVASAVKL